MKQSKTKTACNLPAQPLKNLNFTKVPPALWQMWREQQGNRSCSPKGSSLVWFRILCFLPPGLQFSQTDKTYFCLRRDLLKWQRISAQDIWRTINQWEKDKSIEETWTNDSNRHFSKQGKEMANTHITWCSISLEIPEMQIKLHFKPQWDAVLMIWKKM